MSYSPRSPDRTGHRWPVPVLVVGHGSPLDLAGAEARLEAVAIAVGRLRRVCPVAVEPGAVAGRPLDHLVDHAHRVLDVGVVCRQHAEPHELEEAGVDHRALVDVGLSRRCRGCTRSGRWGRRSCSGAGSTGWAIERPGGRHRPALDVAREVVGRGLVDRGVQRVAVDRRDVRGSRQAGDLGGDRRRRVAVLLLPALDPVARAVVRRGSRPPGSRACGKGRDRPQGPIASPSGSDTTSRRAGRRPCPAPPCRSPASCAASSRRLAAGPRTGSAWPRERCAGRRRRAGR